MPASQRMRGRVSLQSGKLARAFVGGRFGLEGQSMRCASLYEPGTDWRRSVLRVFLKSRRFYNETG